MKRFVYGHRNSGQKVVGLTLTIIGFLLFISCMPIRFLLFLIGVALLLMGAILIMK